MKKLYEVNSNTFAIIALKNSTKIIEEEVEYEVPDKSFEIMDHSCKYFGSSYFGRTTSTKDLTGMTYKVPILVAYNIIFFPTSSPREEGCSFIAYNKVKKIEKMPYNKSRIIFVNDKSIIVPYSYRILYNQILRSCRLSCIINQHLQTIL